MSRTRRRNYDYGPQRRNWRDQRRVDRWKARLWLVLATVATGAIFYVCLVRA